METSATRLQREKNRYETAKSGWVDKQTIYFDTDGLSKEQLEGEDQMGCVDMSYLYTVKENKNDIVLRNPDDTHENVTIYSNYI